MSIKTAGPMSSAQDSRGAIIRCLSDIREYDQRAKITLNYFDLAMNNVRDLLKHAKKEKIKLQSVAALQFSEKVFASKEEKAAMQIPQRLTEEEKAFVAANIEKDYVQFEQAPQNVFS